MINKQMLLEMNSSNFNVLVTRQNLRKLPNLWANENSYLPLVLTAPLGFGLMLSGIPFLATLGIVGFATVTFLGLSLVKAFRKLKNKFKSHLVDIDSKTLARVVYYQQTRQRASMDVELVNSRNMKNIIIRDGSAYVTDQVTKMKDPAVMAWKGTMEACVQAYDLVERRKEAVTRFRQELNTNLEKASAKYAHSKSALMFYSNEFSNRTANRLEDLSQEIKSARRSYNSATKKDFHRESAYGKRYFDALNDCNVFIADTLESFQNKTNQKRVTLGK